MLGRAGAKRADSFHGTQLRPRSRYVLASDKEVSVRSISFVAALLICTMGKSEALEVAIAATIEGQGTPTVVGVTNLPDNSKLLITLIAAKRIIRHKVMRPSSAENFRLVHSAQEARRFRRETTRLRSSFLSRAHNQAPSGKLSEKKTKSWKADWSRRVSSALLRSELRA